MTDRDALYAAILEDPLDDTVRLAYADWCDEHNDPDRAEFIRLQISGDASKFGRVAKLFQVHGLVWGDVSDVVEPASGVSNGVTQSCALGVVLRMPGGDQSATILFERGFGNVLIAPRESQFFAVAEEVFRDYPITCVRTGFMPHRYSASTPNGYLLTAVSFDVYLDKGDEHQPDPGVDPVTFDELHQRFPHRHRSIAIQWIEFDTEADAIRAVSNAYVDLGRRLAGHPPLSGLWEGLT